jgi:uncharacterized Zn finger protein
MSYGSWKPYVSVAERRRKAEKAAAKAAKSGARLAPVTASGGKIAKTFWGQAWCDNLEHYSDFANRLPRGRTYVRNGSVIDLQLAPGQVRAQVMGSSLYRVEVNVDALHDAQWRAVVADCAGSIDSVVALLQGKLSEPVMARLCKPGTGLFPTPREITLHCRCPDWADMCKHVAAVLYGVGARLDTQPELLFALRQVDASALVAQAGAGLPSVHTGKPAAKRRLLDDTALADVFGLEMAADEPAATAPVARAERPSSAKNLAKKAAKKAAKKVAKPALKLASAKPAITAAAIKPTPAKMMPRPARKTTAIRSQAPEDGSA